MPISHEILNLKSLNKVGAKKIFGLMDKRPQRNKDFSWLTFNLEARPGLGVWPLWGLLSEL